MSRWFRVDDGLVDNPKMQQLPPATFKAVVNLWCITSQNGGTLPPIDVIAFKLRMTTAKAEALLDELKTARLIEEDETGMRPHDWNARQYKSDVSTNRVKQFRKRRGNVSSDVSVAQSETQHETPPETETETKEEKKKDAAGAAIEPVDAETALFRRGRDVLDNKNAGGMIAKLLKVKGGNVSLARSALEMAATKENPREYLGRIVADESEEDRKQKLRDTGQAW